VRVKCTFKPRRSPHHGYLCNVPTAQGPDAVDHGGIVYQKKPRTSDRADRPAISQFDPYPRWQKVEPNGLGGE
jgi:hypothetical protein